MAYTIMESMKLEICTNYYLHMLISDKKPSHIIYLIHQKPFNGEQNTNNNDYT